MTDNAHFLVRHGNTFLQASKDCFPVQTITLDHSTLFLAAPSLLQSTTEIANISGFRDVADYTHFLVRHGMTFLQTFKGCFPVQTITLDCSALLLAVLTSSTVDN